MRDTRHYHESSIIVDYPWGTYVRAYGVLCSDGKRRNTKRIASTADTFFSVPASVVVEGKTVAGYISVECMSGSSVHTEDDPYTVKFRAYRYRKNGGLLP